MSKRVLLLAAILAGLLLPAGVQAVDLPNGSTGAYIGGSASTAWAPGGRHWRGHYSMVWREAHPDFVFATPGWGAPWSYRPRSPYEPPRVHMAMPERWTAAWVAYCSERFHSFDPRTGLYTTYSGEKQMCW